MHLPQCPAWCVPALARPFGTTPAMAPDIVIDALHRQQEGEARLTEECRRKAQDEWPTELALQDLWVVKRGRAAAATVRQVLRWGKTCERGSPGKTREEMKKGSVIAPPLLLEQAGTSYGAGATACGVTVTAVLSRFDSNNFAWPFRPQS